MPLEDFEELCCYYLSLYFIIIPLLGCDYLCISLFSFPFLSPPHPAFSLSLDDMIMKQRLVMQPSTLRIATTKLPPLGVTSVLNYVFYPVLSL